MRQLLWASLLLCFAMPCLAQQQDDPEFLKGAVTALQAQRNSALDNQAIAESKLNQANQQIKKLEAKIKEMEDKSKAEEKKK